MFLPNKYTNCYFRIINSAKQLPRLGYTEKHHIIPKSLGGSNELSNLVKLTAKEHFIVHLLLIRMCSNEKDRQKMVQAAWFFRGNVRHSGLKINSNTHRVLKEQWILSITGIKQSSETIAKRIAANTGKKRTEEQKAKMIAGQIQFYSTWTEEQFKVKAEKTKEASANIPADKRLAMNLKISNSKKGKPLSAESIAKRTASVLGSKYSTKNKVEVTFEKRKLAKIWTIMKEDGTSFTVENLKDFCLCNNINLSRMYKTEMNNKFVGGFKTLGKKEQITVHTKMVRKLCHL